MKTILLAEDSQSYAERCRRELEDTGYRVLVARDGREALRLVPEEWPDVVILDICMPAVDGLRALGQIRDVAPQIPVLLLAVAAEDYLRIQLAGLATAWIEKSQNLAELKRVIASALATGSTRTLSCCEVA